MKKSIFCYEKKKGNYTYFFNTLSRVLIRLKEKDLRVLTHYGFYVDDTFDEHKQFLFDYYRQCYNSKFFTITYLLTNTCNFRCTYCFEKDSYKSEKEKNVISPEDLADICEYVINKERVKYLDVNFFGGEPLLKYNDIISAVKRIKALECDSSFNVVTNGYLLNAERVQELKNVGIDSLQITIDGCKEKHDACRVLANGGPTYDVIMRNVLLAIDAGLEVIVNITYTDDDFESIDSFLRDFPAEYKHRTYVKFTRLLDLDRTDIGMLGKLYGSLHKHGFLPQDISHLEYGPCMNKLQNSLLVHADGKLSKCIFDVSEFALGYVEYNNNSANVDKVLLARPIRIQCLDPKCKKCQFLPMCKGGCDRMHNQKKSVCRKKYYESVADAIINYLGDALDE